MELLNQVQLLTEEFLSEIDRTRQFINAIPEEHLNYKPHEKSMSLGALTHHIIALVSWVELALKQEELDFATYTPSTWENLDDLKFNFKKASIAGENALQAADVEDLSKGFVLRSGDFIIVDDNKFNMIRTWIFNHLIHHRGQATVYLRLLDVPVPGLYGPSADEK